MANAEPPLKLRVILEQDDIRKLVLPSAPENVQDLCEILKSEFGLDREFRIQYLDSDFNEFCNLLAMSDVEDKSTLKVIYTSIPDSDLAESLYQELLQTSPSTTASSHTLDESCVSSHSDTSILSSSSGSDSIQRSHPWPTDFPIPKFSYETELKLAKGNAEYEKDRKLMNPACIKSSILEKLAETIFSFKAYPNDLELGAVARALIAKHPCLKEMGSNSGWYGWKTSLKFKMGNYRTKLRNAGCAELAVNSLERNPQDTKRAPSSIKKPRKAEVNYLPDYGEETQDSIERERLDLLEHENRKWNEKELNERMAKTFPQRRKEVVLQKPLAADFKARWPALFTETQICAEFRRITTIPLLSTYFASVDRYSPKLLQLMRCKGGASGKKIRHILDDLDKSNSISVKREVVIRALCEYLNEDNGALFKQFMDNQREEMEDQREKCTMGIFETKELGAELESPSDVSVVVEGEEVLCGVSDMATACCLLFGVIYAMNLSYPKELKYLFEVIQKIFMELDSNKFSPKIQGLKNKLLL